MPKGPLWRGGLGNGWVRPPSLAEHNSLRKASVWLTRTLSLSPSALILILALKRNVVPYWLDLHLMYVPSLSLSPSFSALHCFLGTEWNGQRKWTLHEGAIKLFRLRSGVGNP